MRIGQLAEACEYPAETIRYYEKAGLLPSPNRGKNGYRSYNEHHRKWLQFILRSRALGFKQKEVRRLSNLAHQSAPACAKVQDLMEDHVRDVQEKISELKRMEKALIKLKNKCQDGSLSDCPVIDELMS